MISNFEVQLEKSRNLHRIVLGNESVLRLNDWGIQNDQIQTLTNEIMPQFNYAGCVEKIRRISEKKIFLDLNKNEVTIPFLYDIMGRGDGQCGDLADQLLVNGNFVAWLEDINTNREDKIVPYFCNGNSKTHFNFPDKRTHIFVGIFPESQDPDKMVVIDPSFGVVGTLNETGYSVKGVRSDRSKKLLRQLHSNLILSTITRTGFGKSEIDLREGKVLGVSEDRQFAYALLLAKYSDSEKITPVIQVYFENSAVTSHYWLDPDLKTVTGDSTFAKDSFSIESQKEIEEMLKTSDNFIYTKNISEASGIILTNSPDLEANISF